MSTSSKIKTESFMENFNNLPNQKNPSNFHPMNNSMFPWPDSNPLNKNSTVIETQQIINCTNSSIHIGDTYYFGSQKNSNVENDNVNKNKKKRTRSTVGEYNH